MNKRFDNVTHIDPGRFRYPVTFIEAGVVILADLSQIPGYIPLISTRAVREPVTRRFNVAGDTTLQAGATLMNNYWYFYVRFIRSGNFMPLKDMLLQTPDGIYTITAAPEVDEPANYWKILCIKSDIIITT